MSFISRFNSKKTVNLSTNSRKTSAIGLIKANSAAVGSQTRVNTSTGYPLNG